MAALTVVFSGLSNIDFFLTSRTNNGVQDCCEYCFYVIPILEKLLWEYFSHSCLWKTSASSFYVIPVSEKLLWAVFMLLLSVKNCCEQFSCYSCQWKTAVSIVFMLFLSVKNCCEHSFHVVPVSGKTAVSIVFMLFRSRKTAVSIVFMLFLSVKNCCEHSLHVIPVSEKLLWA